MSCAQKRHLQSQATCPSRSHLNPRAISASILACRLATAGLTSVILPRGTLARQTQVARRNLVPRQLQVPRDDSKRSASDIENTSLLNTMTLAATGSFLKVGWDVFHVAVVSSKLRPSSMFQTLRQYVQASWIFAACGNRPYARQKFMMFLICLRSSSLLP
mmetsp:Transcript_123302/g.195536  ORF Transcript_123302/g.195536 Transcript_123302/m.195536 type:complete len:161 (+) Transcript_123302:471-953(+)